MPRPALTHHFPLDFFNVKDHCLLIGNKNFMDILAPHADLPAYIYDRSVIKKKIALLRKYLPGRIHIHYAIKANPMFEVVDFVQGQVDGLDVASGKELQVALASGMPAGAISFAGPGKSQAELTLAVKNAITMSLESLTELKRTLTIGEQLGITPRVALRVNPNFELKTAGMKMSGGPKPFGVDAEMAPEIIQKIISCRLDFRGLQIFSGSQNLNAEAIIAAQAKTFALAAQLAEQTHSEFGQLNIGGGFGIPYFAGEKPLALAPIGDNLHALLDRYDRRFGGTGIIIELGRYIVGESGVYIAKIIDKKISRGSTFLIVNGGLHHHLAASGNFGQVIRRNYPVTIANKIGLAGEKASVVGPLCTPLDVLAQDMRLPQANIDDYVAVFNSGAYGYTSSPVNFLSHPHPLEIFI